MCSEITVLPHEVRAPIDITSSVEGVNERERTRTNEQAAQSGCLAVQICLRANQID